MAQVAGEDVVHAQVVPTWIPPMCRATECSRLQVLHVAESSPPPVVCLGARSGTGVEALLQRSSVYSIVKSACLRWHCAHHEA